MNQGWSSKQDEALRIVDRWMRDRRAPQVLYMAGYAGTGKTTLAKHLVSGASRRWLFASLTGKATHVLRQKGCEGAKTIHSLIYRPNGETKAGEIRLLEDRRRRYGRIASDESVDEEKRVEARQRYNEISRKIVELHAEKEPMFALWANSPLADDDVEGIVVDECSMIDDRLGRDLESFGKKILAQGDPAQLPPVGAVGRYSKLKPDVMLTEVHRQAQESGILRLATAIRTGERLDSFETPDCRVVFKEDCSRDELAGIVLQADQVLVGRNATRRAFNMRHRELLGMRGPLPRTQDRLVCLRNDPSIGIYNGSQWLVESATSDVAAKTCQLELQSEDDPTNRIALPSWLHHMIGLEHELTEMGWDRRDLAEFDYAYALTVHKSQGSQWGSVALFDESRAFGADVGRRWLYTGITRASEKLTVIA